MPDQVTATVASFTADGAYDQEGVSSAVAERYPKAAIIVPPPPTDVTLSELAIETFLPAEPSTAEALRTLLDRVAAPP